MQDKFEITLEKNKNWDIEVLLSKKRLGIQGFTVTDLPFSSVLQAYWFLAAAFANTFLEKTKFWQDTDSYFFYKNVVGSKSNGKNILEIFKTFWKLQKRLIDHENTFDAVKYTPDAIVSVACNFRSKKFLENRIDKLLESGVTKMFIVSGGGIGQRFFKKFLVDSSDLFSYARNKYPNLEIYSAVNTNLHSENVERLIKKGGSKNIDIALTQPPFIWSNFEKWLKDVSENENTKNIQIRVGMPIFTNPWNVRFWMMLVGVNWKKEKEAESIVRVFEREWDKDETVKKDRFKEFSKNWTLNLINSLKEWQKQYSQITGIHIMPMGNFINVDEIIQICNTKP